MTLSKKQKEIKKFRKIGIDSSPPSQTCNDNSCPWHGTLPVRGRIFSGIVHSDKARRTVTVKWDFIKYISKYERYARSHSRVIAYNPDCINAKKGDKVKIAECRPISKTKSFVVVEVLK